MLQLAAAVEKPLGTPLAAAIVRAARERGLEIPEASGFRALEGPRRHGEGRGRLVAVRSGRPFFIEQESTSGRSRTRWTTWRRGAATRLVAVDGAPARCWASADPIKPSAVPAVRASRRWAPARARDRDVRKVRHRGGRGSGMTRSSRGCSRREGCGHQAAAGVPGSGSRWWAMGSTTRRTRRRRCGPGLGKGTDVAVEGRGRRPDERRLRAAVSALELSRPPCASSGRTCLGVRLQHRGHPDRGRAWLYPVTASCFAHSGERRDGLLIGVRGDQTACVSGASRRASPHDACGPEPVPSALHGAVSARPDRVF